MLPIHHHGVRMEALATGLGRPRPGSRTYSRCHCRIRMSVNRRLAWVAPGTWAALLCGQVERRGARGGLPISGRRG